MSTLQRQQWFILLIGMNTLAFGFLLLQRNHFESATTWVIIATITFSVHYTILRHNINLNHHPDDHVLLPSLGLANSMTIVRGLLNCLVAGFIFSAWPEGWLRWVPAILYTIGALLDIFDGLVARLTKYPTVLGEKLDLEYDALGLLIINALIVWYGQLPWWLLIFGVARYAFVLGVWWRERNDLPIRDLTTSNNRRVAAGLMMGMLSVLIWPIVEPPETVVAGYLFGLPFAIIFVRDWLVVSDQLDPANGTYGYWRDVTERVCRDWLPVVARLGAIGLVMMNGYVLEWTGWIGLVLVGLGVFGRIGALFLIAFAVLTVSDLWLLTLAITIVNFGSGRFALFPADELIFARRYG